MAHPSAGAWPRGPGPRRAGGGARSHRPGWRRRRRRRAGRRPADLPGARRDPGARAHRSRRTRWAPRPRPPTHARALLRAGSRPSSRGRAGAAGRARRACLARGAPRGRAPPPPASIARCGPERGARSRAGRPPRRVVVARRLAVGLPQLGVGGHPLELAVAACRAVHQVAEGHAERIGGRGEAAVAHLAGHPQVCDEVARGTGAAGHRHLGASRSPASRAPARAISGVEQASATISGSSGAR